jgi:group I intron endonuclease
MIGIYKITSPSGRIYIGQSTQIEKRWKRYSKVDCKGQIRLYRSLLKYGYSRHIFEIVEECIFEKLNIRERYWQDFYKVLGENGLNSKLQSTDELKSVHSQDSIDRQAASLRKFYTTPKGREVAAQRVANIDWEKKVANTDYRAIVANTDYSLFQEKRLLSRDEVTRALRTVANTDYALRTRNMDWTTKVANTDYKSIAKKNMKPINQYKKDGTFIREWSSQKEAIEELKIDKSGISACLKNKQKTSGGFIWKYKD